VPFRGADQILHRRIGGAHLGQDRERIRGPQLLALAAIVVGITLMYRGQVSLSGRSIVGIEEVFAPVRTIATVIRGTLVRVRV